MDIRKLLSADYLDILFEGRNKSYGSYELRRKYAQRARNATLYVLLGTCLALTGPVIASRLAPENGVLRAPEGRITPVLPPIVNPPKPPVQLVAPPPPPPTFRNPPPTIVHDDVPIEEPPKEEDTHGKVPGLVTTTGPATDEHGLIPSAGPTGLPRTIEEPPADDRKIYTGAIEQLPRFNGDLQAFLNSHLRYPEESKERGEQGRSVIQFVVNTDGSIQDVVVVRSAAPLLDAEAARVVRAMPTWTPGKQNGKLVRVQYSIPVVWKLD